MRNFKEYDIWIDSMKIATSIYDICSTFPDNEKYGLISQMKRASVSVPSNIAEGSAKTSTKDFLRFLEISLGSCYELETQLELSCSFKFISIERYKVIRAEIISLQKRISGLIQSLKKSNANVD